MSDHALAPLYNLRVHPTLPDVFVETITRRLWRKNAKGEWARTYPSWETRHPREAIAPDYVVEPNAQDKLMAGQITIHLRQQGIDNHNGVERKVLTDAIKDITGKKVGNFGILKRLWRAGLVRRTGVKFDRSGRYTKQIWYTKEI